MDVLGISAFFHDSAAALVRDGEVVAAAQQERFSRRKGDPSFPSDAIAYCLREGGTDVAEVDHVAFYEKPLVKFDRLLDTYARVGPAGWPSARGGWVSWARQRLEIPAALRRELGGGDAPPVHFTEHHAAHAASAFYPSPHERAAVLVMDAVGEWATSSIWVGSDAGLQPVEEIRFPHSLGMLYSAFTHYTGFAVNAGEYKVMGLAPYGEPRFLDLILDEVATLREDGSLHLDLRCFEYDRGRTMTSARLHRLMGGPPREPGGPLDQRHIDIAASVQRVCELAVLRTARHAHALTAESALTMAGGVALNCAANGRVRRESPFDDVWVQPAAGDAGGALGAALCVSHTVLAQPRTRRSPDGQRASLLGPAFGNRDIGLFLDGVGAHHERIDAEEDLLDRVARLLEEGEVVGWFQGRMEFGPRALGCRSIIADPRSPTMQRTVNHKIKFRESFRPFAPSVLREHAHEIFDVDRDADLPYMLFVASLRSKHLRRLTVDERRRAAHPDVHVRVSVPRSPLPAITHVDHSARIQTVDRTRHGRYWRLLRRFHERTGSPVLLNTSFNVRGEPIVHSPQDAYDCFLATGMDVLVLENHLVTKPRRASHVDGRVLESAAVDPGRRC